MKSTNKGDLAFTNGDTCDSVPNPNIEGDVSICPMAINALGDYFAPGRVRSIAICVSVCLSVRS